MSPNVAFPFSHEKEDQARLLNTILNDRALYSVIKKIEYMDGKSFKNLDLVTLQTDHRDISSLYDNLDFIADAKPKTVLWVTSVEAISYKEVYGGNEGSSGFLEYLTHLASCGYVTHYRVINAADFGSAHADTKLFMVSYLVEVEAQRGQKFKFPTRDTSIENEKLSDFLELDDTNYDLLYSITPSSKEASLLIDGLPLGTEKSIRVRDDFSQHGYTYLNEGESILLDSPDKKIPNRVTSIVPHIGIDMRYGTYWNGVVRYLSPIEHGLLQGFKRSEVSGFYGYGFTDSMLHKYLGRTVNQKVIKALLKEIIEFIGKEEVTK